jgi:hypothetical protein
MYSFCFPVLPAWMTMMSKIPYDARCTFLAGGEKELANVADVPLRSRIVRAEIVSHWSQLTVLLRVDVKRHHLLAVLFT